MNVSISPRREPLDLTRERPLAGRIDSPDLQLVEIFDSLQGEGPDIGMPARFVRLAHCNRRCVWCDTDYRLRFELSVPEFVELMAQDYAEVTPHERAYVIFTGGEPTLQAGLLLEAMQELTARLPIGWHWACESNGTLLHQPEVAAFYREMHTLVISPKPPSSQNPPFNWDDFWARIAEHKLEPRLVLKPVVMDDADLAWLRAAAESPARPLSVPFVIQTGVDPNPASSAMPDFQGYWRRTLTPEFMVWMRRFNTRLIPRLHNLIWGNQQGY